MSGGTKLSNELNRLKDEARSVDDEIRRLRTRKRDLEQKIAMLESRIAARANSAAEELSSWESDSFAWSAEIRDILRSSFRLNDFRPLQRSAMNVVMSGEDCLLIMSTGGGKSLTYQLPAVTKKGVTLVVSPLVSLIEDQIIQLSKLGIRAATLNQHSTKEEVKFVHDALGDAKTDLRLLYVTPEKLAKSKRIMNRLEKCSENGSLKLIAVDEVHCCSQWGHDFRPDYQFLNILKRQFKGVPILGLTATATANVLEDVKEILGIKGAITLRSTFNRENLFYEVRQKPSSNSAMLDEMVSVLKNEFPDQTGIIYCFSRKECEEVAAHLRGEGIATAYYHAYLEPEKRRKVHEQWLSGRYKIIVATLAFGMGIDKPDVRFVIHHSMAKSMENYYQESGRAGRDGKPAKCILYYKIADLFRQSTMVCSEKTGVQNLYSMLAYAIQGTECRRVSIAEHFDESWDASWCREMCDTCKTGCGMTGQVNAAPILAEILQIIKAQAQTDQNRITGNKLLDILGKTASGKKFEKNTLEEIVAHLLLDGYLCEDFHFTPYNIISYVQPTERSRSFTPDSEIFVNLLPTDGPAKKTGKRKSKTEPEAAVKTDSTPSNAPDSLIAEADAFFTSYNAARWTADDAAYGSMNTETTSVMPTLSYPNFSYNGYAPNLSSHDHAGYTTVPIGPPFANFPTYSYPTPFVLANTQVHRPGLSKWRIWLAPGQREQIVERLKNEIFPWPNPPSYIIEPRIRNRTAHARGLELDIHMQASDIQHYFVLVNEKITHLRKDSLLIMQRDLVELHVTTLRKFYLKQITIKGMNKRL